MSKNNYTRIINLRLTEIELINLNELYQLSGRRNRSKFIRDLIFRKDIYIHNYKEKVVKAPSDATKSRDRIAKLCIELKAEINRIGVNYNQVVRQVNSRPTEKRMLALFYKLQDLTTQMIRMHGQVINLLEEIEEDDR